jgi:hypothetical protein
VAYGHNSIWMWAAQPRVPEGHEAIGIVPPWSAGLDTAGIRSMTTLRDFFESIAWWQLRPAPELLKEQPGTVDPERFIAAAKSIDHQTGLLYLPQGGSVALRLEAWPNQIAADWFDPRLGTRQAAIADKHMANQYTAPSHQDWLLHLHT